MGETMMKDDITTLEDGGFPLTEAQITHSLIHLHLWHALPKKLLNFMGSPFFLSLEQMPQNRAVPGSRKRALTLYFNTSL